jgi:hypothetical protein
MRGRRAIGAVGLVALLLGAAGCSLSTPIAFRLTS